MVPHFLIEFRFPLFMSPESHWSPLRFLTYFLTSLVPRVFITLPAATPPRWRPKAETTWTVLLSVASCRWPSAGNTLPAACSRTLPLRRNPLLLFQTVQRRIERTGIHLQNLAGTIADRHANPIPVLRSPLQCLQNQQVQRPLQ